MSTHTKSFTSRMFSILILLALLLGAAGVTPAQAGGGVLHVKTSATGTGDCFSWANACTLQTALGMSDPANPVWVMKGTYKPTTGTNRSATFQLRAGGAVYGGFDGTETSLGQRDFETNVTILSGFLGSPLGSSYHVVTGAEGAILDGFTISFGQADEDFPNSRGGGMYNDSVSPILRNLIFHHNEATYGGALYNSVSDPTLENVTFEENSAEYGGGMYNKSSHPTLTDVVFDGNSAVEDGGGLYNANSSNPILLRVTFNVNSASKMGGGMANYSSHPTLTDVIFSENTTGEYYGKGGGLYNSSSHPTLNNVTFSQNEAHLGGGLYNLSSNSTLTNVTFSGNRGLSELVLGGAGGGIFNSSSSPVLTNVTFSNNHAEGMGSIGGGMYNTENGTPTLTNTIFWGNTAEADGPQLYSYSGTIDINYSVIEGGYPLGTHNLTADPKLGTLGNYGGFTQTIPILAGSSAIDSGDNASCPDTDQRGLSRPWDGNGSGGAVCDIGAYEVPSPSPVFVDVPIGYWAISHIESLYANGITGGCGGGNYCPTNPVTRGQMAVFLLKGMYGSAYTPPAATGTVFNDVPLSNLFAAWIEQLYAEGITGGCGGGNYCPNTPVNREQMAVFLLVAEHGTGYTPPAATGVFADVSAGYAFAPWIEALAAEGITGGCGGGNFCPKTVVNRAQMAVFLVAAFNLP